jgi:hypothetical protein
MHHINHFPSCVHPETPDGHSIVFIWETSNFPKVKEIKRLCGGVVVYAAQASEQIDAEIGEKGRFRMNTRFAFNFACEQCLCRM